MFQFVKLKKIKYLHYIKTSDIIFEFSNKLLLKHILRNAIF